MTILVVQRRMMEIARMRLGKKGDKGQPEKIDTLRFTSASREWLENVATLHGGTVREWEGAPDDGYFEVITDAKKIDIVFPPIFSAQDGTPTLPCSQWLELWSGGGCQRRCDGETEALSGKPCLCNPEDRACKPTTRISFMLPDVPGFGLVRFESHGWNAAAELPGTVELLMRASAQGSFIRAVFRAEPRTSKQNGKTLRYVVPVIDVPGLKIGEVLAGDSTLSLNAPAARPPRPALPAGEGPPDEPDAFENERDPDFGAPPAIEQASEGVEGSPPSEDIVDAEAEEVPDVDPEIRTAWTTLTDLVVEIGATESLPGINAKAAAGDLAWMKRQITRAKKTLADKKELPVQEALPDGYFERRAQEAQEAKAARKGRSR